MPHSSGGGSRSGGTHSGSRGSGSSKFSFQVTSSPFQGAYKYVRFRRGKKHVIYSNNPRFNHIGIDDVLGVCFPCGFLFFNVVILVWYLVTALILPQKPLVVDYVSEISIDDKLGVIGDYSVIKDKLVDFLNITGITVCIETLEETDLVGKSLEDYAYDSYVNQFKDEKHWLIVYCENGDEWFFEGMQGDDTDSILLEKKTSQFNDLLHKNLKECSVQYAFVKTFDSFNKTVMNHKDTLDLYLFEILVYLGVCLVFVLLGSIIFWTVILRRLGYKKVEE